MHKILIFLCLASFGICEELDVKKISEAMGHLIGKNLQDLGVEIDLTAVIQGIQDASEGKNSPLSDDECVQAIALLQEEKVEKISEKTLEEADSVSNSQQLYDSIGKNFFDDEILEVR